MRKIYVASSWRNEDQQSVVTALKDVGHEVYDFKHPSVGDDGFHWSQIDSEWKSWTSKKLQLNLDHPIASNGFDSDFKSMEWADTCIYVLPCGRSASLEAGWFIGRGILSICLLDDGEPDLMYKLFDYVCIDMREVMNALES